MRGVTLSIHIVSMAGLGLRLCTCEGGTEKIPYVFIGAYWCLLGCDITCIYIVYCVCMYIFIYTVYCYRKWFILGGLH